MSEIEIKNNSELIDYKSAIKFMENRVLEIINNKSNELIWFLKHDHIYTQGTSSNNNEIIKKNNLKIIKTNRGGKITYHGPGQRIIYFMINLNKRKKDIRKFISTIENSLIDFLKIYNIEATSYKDRVGIWVTKSNNKKFNKEKKIGAIGLRVKKWVTYHGLSFNINPELDYYNFINSCGLENYENTSLSEIGLEIHEREFDENFTKIFIDNLSKL